MYIRRNDVSTDGPSCDVNVLGFTRCTMTPFRLIINKLNLHYNQFMKSTSIKILYSRPSAINLSTLPTLVRFLISNNSLWTSINDVSDMQALASKQHQASGMLKLQLRDPRQLARQANSLWLADIHSSMEKLPG